MVAVGTGQVMLSQSRARQHTTAETGPGQPAGGVEILGLIGIQELDHHETARSTGMGIAKRQRKTRPLAPRVRGEGDPVLDLR